MNVSRAVAQPGSALAWGARGREFESLRPDHFLKKLSKTALSSRSEELFLWASLKARLWYLKLRGDRVSSFVCNAYSERTVGVAREKYRLSGEGKFNACVVEAAKDFEV